MCLLAAHMLQVVCVSIQGVDFYFRVFMATMVLLGSP